MTLRLILRHAFILSINSAAGAASRLL